MRKKVLDALDYKILDELCRDARIPLSKIAKDASVSIPSVSERMRKLISTGIIKGFVPRLDYNALGYNLLAVTSVNTKYGHNYANRVGTKLSRIPGVEDVHFVLGDLDFIVISRARDRDDLKRIVDSFIEISEIEKTSTHIVLHTLKESRMIPSEPKKQRRRPRFALVRQSNRAKT